MPEEEKELLENIFRYDLKESPINIDAYEPLAEADEDVRYSLDTMLETCLAYTEDVAIMERYVREHVGQYDEDREAVDQSRSRAHDAMISSVDIFARVLRSKKQDTSWLKWDHDNRGRYGNFAILLTLNRFKEDLIARKLVENMETLQGNGLDFNEIKIGASAAEMKIIRYVEVLSSMLEAEDLAGSEPEQNASQPSVSELKIIETELGKDGSAILGAFHQIYLRRYE